MSVASRIRALRRRRGLTLDALAEAVGVHKGHLSRIERGEKAPSLTTLEAIGTALGADMASLFGERIEADEVVVVRGAEAMGVRETGVREMGVREPDYAVHALVPAREGRAAALYLVEPGDAFRDADRPSHGGQEIAYVLRGRVELAVADRRVTLQAGDCATYDGGLPHRLRRLGPDPAAVLVMIAAG